MSNPEPKLEPETGDLDDIECEIADLVADHGSERAALRAVLHEKSVLLVDADRSLRGLFSEGARPVRDDER